jgi:hypothetical protein
MIKETEINNHLLRGIIEANLDFSKEENSPFSLIKFEYKLDLDNINYFKDFISFVCTSTDFSPIIRHEDDTFLILLKKTKVHQAKALMNKLIYECGNRFKTNIRNIGITLSNPDDTYKILMDRVDKYFVMSKLSSSEKIFYGTVDFDYYDTMDPTKVLQNIFAKFSPIILNNLYKGIPIQSSAKVDGFSDGIIRIKINSDKIPFYENEKFTFIQHDMIPDIIKADILKIDEHRLVMVLGNLQFLRSSPVERSSIRISPNKELKATLIKEFDTLVEGVITSISENSISLQVSPEETKQLMNSDLYQKELNLKFSLPNSRGIFTDIEVKAYVFNIQNNQIILNISANSTEEVSIRDFISEQQNELLEALKTKLKTKGKIAF